MPKRRPPRPSNPARPGLTAASPAVEILRAKVKAQLEMIGRKAYQELLVLQAELAKLPPVPEASGSPDNDA